MILGASHLTLGCEDIDACITELAGLGYAPVFIERALPNVSEKSPFLTHSYERHDIAFMRASGGLPIELIRYGAMASGQQGAFLGYFARTSLPSGPADLASPILESLRLAGASKQAAQCAIPALRTSAIFDPEGASSGLTMAALLTRDISASRRFWANGLGYTVVRNDPNSCVLDFKSPVAAWQFRVVLVAGELLASQAMLDSSGMICFSHICSALSRDRERLIEGGAAAWSGAFEISVNGRELIVEILRGPSGELIELLQVGT